MRFALRGLILMSAPLAACSAPQPSAKPGPIAAAPMPKPVPTASAAALDSALPSRPPRKFAVNGAPVAIDTRYSGLGGALSPDGTIVAGPGRDREIAFYDVDRNIVVGRAPLPDGSWHLGETRWFGDDTLAIATVEAVATYDGRTGVLRASAPGVYRGFVTTPRGPAFATVEGDEPPQATRLAIRPLEAPATVIASATLPHAVEVVLDTGAGGFVALTKQSAAAYDATGKPRWSTSESVERLGLEARTGQVIWLDTGTSVLDGATFTEREELTSFARARNRYGRPQPAPLPGMPAEIVDVDFGVQYTPLGAVEMAMDKAAAASAAASRPSGAPDFARRAANPQTQPDPPTVEGPNGTSFTARCYGLPPATLGTPTRPVAPPAKEDHRGYRFSPDGALLATYGPRVSNEYTERVSRSGTSTRVEITHAPTDGGWKGVHLRMLDHRELVQDFAFHPSGSLVVAGVTTVKIWNPHDGKLERTLPGDDFTLSDDGRWLFVSSPRDAAIYEWSTMRLVGRWAGSLRAIAVSPTERFAVLHEVVKSPATLNHYVVAIRVMDLKSRRARIVRDANEVGFAFSPDDRWFALAPVASLEISMGPQLAYGIVLHDLATGKVASMLRVQGGGERPFFAKGSDVVGYHTPGGLRLVRRADQRTVDVGAFEKDGKCGIFAVDSAGGFEGEPRGALGFRLGSDLRTSEVVVSGPAFEAQRRRDLVGELLDGK